MARVPNSEFAQGGYPMSYGSGSTLFAVDDTIGVNCRLDGKACQGLYLVSGGALAYAINARILGAPSVGNGFEKVYLTSDFSSGLADLYADVDSFDSATNIATLSLTGSPTINLTALDNGGIIRTGDFIREESLGYEYPVVDVIGPQTFRILAPTGTSTGTFLGDSAASGALSFVRERNRQNWEDRFNWLDSGLGTHELLSVGSFFNGAAGPRQIEASSRNNPIRSLAVLGTAAITLGLATYVY